MISYYYCLYSNKLKVVWSWLLMYLLIWEERKMLQFTHKVTQITRKWQSMRNDIISKISGLSSNEGTSRRWLVWLCLNSVKLWPKSINKPSSASEPWGNKLMLRGQIHLWKKDNKRKTTRVICRMRPSVDMPLLDWGVGDELSSSEEKTATNREGGRRVRLCLHPVWPWETFLHLETTWHMN